MEAATAAALPPELPPALRWGPTPLGDAKVPRGKNGFITGPDAECTL